MDLIIGTRHIIPDAITRTATGIEAVLHGDALEIDRLGPHIHIAQAFFGFAHCSKHFGLQPWQLAQRMPWQ